MTTIMCKSCGADLPPEDFERRADTGRLRRDCRDCRKEAKRTGPRPVPLLPPEPLLLDGFLPMPAPGERRALVYPLGYGVAA